MTTETRAKLYKHYPVPSVLLYNGSTVLHFFLGFHAAAPDAGR